MIKKYRLYIQILFVSIVAYLGDKLFFKTFFPTVENTFKHSIETVFGFFIFCSFAILLLLSKVKEKNINSVGQTFLLVTSIKMALSYMLVHPILQLKTETASIEKTNFFIAFTLFLTIETLFTIKILNKKQ